MWQRAKARAGKCALRMRASSASWTAGLSGSLEDKGGEIESEPLDSLPLDASSIQTQARNSREGRPPGVPAAGPRVRRVARCLRPDPLRRAAGPPTRSSCAGRSALWRDGLKASTKPEYRLGFLTLPLSSRLPAASHRPARGGLRVPAAPRVPGRPRDPPLRSTRRSVDPPRTAARPGGRVTSGRAGGNRLMD